MCRLLGYATSGFNLSLNDVLGMHEVTDFRDLSEIHNDGWGVALLSNPTELPFAAGEVRKPETGTKLYKSTLAARHDPIFRDFADDPARGGLWHLRLASSNLPLIRRIYKKYPEFIKTEENRYLIDRRQRKACALFSKVGQAFILQPKQPLPLSSMRADEKSLRTLYAMGYDDARESFPQLLEFLSK